jgi:hypothetical protein
LGVVTDEAIIEYIRTQDVTKDDGDFKVDDETAMRFSGRDDERALHPRPH